MSETIDSDRRWSGFVCPDCRFVFRVPRDHDGKGVVCPSCRRILRIPAAGDTPPPLISQLRRVQAGEYGQPEAEGKRINERRSKKAHAAAGPSWESESHQSSGAERKQLRLMLIGGGILFAFIVVGVIFALGSGKTPESALPVKTESLPESVAQAAVSATARGGLSLLAEAESIAWKFMNATSVEEILPLVHKPEVAEARIRRQYPDGKISAPGMSDFNISERRDFGVGVSAVLVRTRDFENKTIHFIGGPQGLKIDWESWIGWSEMPWAEFMANKPTTSQMFRLILSPVDYYNFDFSEESKWRSYRLLSPDKEHSLYGYAEREGLVEGQLRHAGADQTLSLMLSLKFPQGATSKNQVVIERLVADGWVENEEAP
ncbi:MAG: hypothetical protein WEB53_08165 [Akkermansiaceae bacterium]